MTILTKAFYQPFLSTSFTQTPSPSSVLDFVFSEPLEHPLWKHPLQDVAPFQSSSSSRRFHIHQDNDKYSLIMDVPGIKQQDMNIQVDEKRRVLRVTGTRKITRSGSLEEYASSTMERSVVLGDDIDMDTITAEMNDGVLTVTAMKKSKEELVPRTRVIAITNGKNESEIDAVTEGVDEGVREGDMVGNDVSEFVVVGKDK